MHSSNENSHFSKIGIFYAKMNCYHGKLWKISRLLLEIYIMQGISWTFMLPRGKRLRWSARTSSENVSLRIPLVVRRNTTNLAFFLTISGQTHYIVIFDGISYVLRYSVQFVMSRGLKGTQNTPTCSICTVNKYN